eukprot:14546807-Alexandrium_andersonii.AAC.1
MLQGLVDEAVRHVARCRIFVAHVVSEAAGAWTPLAAVAASCAAWGSRAARLLEQVEYIGCPCRAGEPGRTRPAR